jgi:segregation and condensation protein B
MMSQETNEPIGTESATEGDATEESTETEPCVDDVDDADDHVRRLARILESVLFASGTPLGLRKLIEVLATSGSRPAAKDVQAALAALQRRYGPGQRGIQLHAVAGGYQFRTARENAEWVRAVFRDKPARLGRATLETLAIIAYKQPVTRVDIEAIRGVDVDGVLTTLLARRLIKIAGRKEAVGRPLLYATTPEFLETFGLKDLNELPSLKELGPLPEGDDADLSATLEPQTAAAPAATGAADGAEPAGGAAQDAGARVAAAPAEDSEPGRDRLAAEGGGTDPDGARAGERAAGDSPGNQGGSPPRPDHG